jgi:hypothetical protein
LHVDVHFKKTQKLLAKKGGHDKQMSAMLAGFWELRHCGNAFGFLASNVTSQQIQSINCMPPIFGEEVDTTVVYFLLSS